MTNVNKINKVTILGVGAVALCAGVFLNCGKNSSQKNSGAPAPAIVETEPSEVPQITPSKYVMAGQMLKNTCATWVQEYGIRSLPVSFQNIHNQIQSAEVKTAAEFCHTDGANITLKINRIEGLGTPYYFSYTLSPNESGDYTFTTEGISDCIAKATPANIDYMRKSYSSLTTEAILKIKDVTSLQQCPAISEAIKTAIFNMAK
jgi:hypothetical protein